MTIRLRAETTTTHTMDGTANGDGVQRSLIHSSFISDHLVYCEGLVRGCLPT